MGSADRLDKAPIRWARGFFRAWLAIAALWVLGVGAAGVNSVTNIYSYVPDSTYLLDASTKRVSSMSRYGAEYTDAMKAVDGGAYRRTIRNAGSSVLEFFAPATVSAADLSATADGVSGAITRAAREAATKSAWAGVPAYVMGALIPPAVLLLLGALLGWIIVGFSPRR